MQVIRVIAQIAILWGFYFVGQLIVAWTGIFIPASIIGLLLLWICLMTKIIKVKLIQAGASFLIAFLTLFFVPTTVGVMEYPELLTVEGGLLLLAVVISSAVTLVFSGKVSQFIEKKESRIEEERYVQSHHHR